LRPDHPRQPDRLIERSRTLAVWNKLAPQRARFPRGSRLRWRRPEGPRRRRRRGRQAGRTWRGWACRNWRTSCRGRLPFTAWCSATWSTWISAGRRNVTGANVLVAIFSERGSQADHLLQQRKMDRRDAVNFIAHGIRKDRGREA